MINKNKAADKLKGTLPGHVTFLSLPTLTSSAPVKEPHNFYLPSNTVTI